MVGIGEIEHIHVGKGFALTTVVVFYYAIKILVPEECSYHIALY